MAKSLLRFLFGESQVDDEISTLVEEIADMDTDGTGERLKIDKQPLEKALTALDIDTEGLEKDPRGFSLVFRDNDAYQAAHTLLNQPDNMHKLAVLGWVYSPQGDVAQSNEPPQYRIRFLEITEVDQNNEEPKPTKGTAKNTKLSAVIKKGREFATTKPEHDDDMNPVEYDKKGSSDRHKGMSKEKDGAEATGSWKSGAVKGAQKESLHRDDFDSDKCVKCGRTKKRGEVCDHSKGSMVPPPPTSESMEPATKKKKGVGSAAQGASPAGTIKGATPGSSVDRQSKPGKGGLTKPADGGTAPKAMKEDMPGETATLHAPGCTCDNCREKALDPSANLPLGDNPDTSPFSPLADPGKHKSTYHSTPWDPATGYIGRRMHMGEDNKYRRLKCPGCEALAVNGTATHEHGCPHSRKRWVPSEDGNYLVPSNEPEEQEESLQEGAHKKGCTCGFCKNKGNINDRNKPKKDDGEKDTDEMEEGLSAEQIVDRILDGEANLLEMHPENVGTPPGIMGHKSYSTMKVPKSYPDRKFSPAKGMVQPDNFEVNQQTKRKVKSV